MSLRTHGALLVTACLLTGCQGTGRPVWMSSTQAQNRLDVARLHEKDGQLNEARELYGKLRKSKADQARVCQRLAVVNAQLGDHEASKRFFEEALGYAPNDTEILSDYGYALLTHGDYEAAETVLTRAVATDAKNRRAVNNLGLAVAHQGRDDEAFQIFRRVNDEAASHSNVAYVLAQRGQGANAVERYSKALAIDPDSQNSQQGLLQIAQMQMRVNDGGLDASNIASRSRQPVPQEPVVEKTHVERPVNSAANVAAIERSPQQTEIDVQSTPKAAPILPVEFAEGESSSPEESPVTPAEQQQPAEQPQPADDQESDWLPPVWAVEDDLDSEFE